MRGLSPFRGAAVDADLAPLLQHIRRLTACAAPGAPGDAALLECFVRDRDEAAFAALVGRHGPMVWRVCRRALADAGDAEDVFQATFLVLARKAAVLRRPEALAAWLFGVARRLAGKCRAAARRNRHERRPPVAADRDPLEELSAREWVQILDEEVGRLPEVYRLPVILCCLEGRTQEEAAALLGWTPGSLKGRLERGRKALHARLTRRGLDLSAGLLAAAAGFGEAEAGVPAVLTAAAVRAALSFASGSGAAARVTALAEEALRGFGMGKAALGLALVLAAGVAALAAVGPRQAPVGPPPAEPRPAAQAPAEKRAARTDLYGDPLPEGAVARLGTLRFRSNREQSTNLLAYSPDGKTLAVLAGNRPGCWCCLLDAATGRRMDLPLEQSTRVWSLAFAPEGTRLALTCSGPTPGPPWVEIWDLKRKERLRTIAAGATDCLSWSADGRTLVTVGASAVHWWDAAGGRRLRQAEQKWLPEDHTRWPSPVLTPDGRTLFGLDSDGGPHVVDLEKNQERLAEKGRVGGVRWLAISPDGRIASLDGGEGLKVWRLGGDKQTLTLAGSGYREGAAFAPDGRTLATTDHKGITLWDVQTGKERRRIAGSPQECGGKIAFSPDGATLVSVGRYDNSALHFWDVAAGRLKDEPQGHGSRPVCIAFAPDGVRVATSGGMDGTLGLWEVATGKPLGLIRRGSEWMRDCTFSADGRLLYATTTGSDLVAFDPATGKEVHRLSLDDPERPDTKQSGIALSSVNGRNTLVAFSYYYAASGVGGPGEDTLITGWDARTRRLLFRRRQALPNMGRVVSPDGRLLALAEHSGEQPRYLHPSGLGPMRVQELATGRQLCSIGGNVEAGGQTLPHAFSPDGRLLVSSTSRPAPGGRASVMHLWELPSGSQVLELPCELLTPVAFSADGRLLAFAAPLGRIAVWDLVKWREVRRFPGHGDFLVSLAFSPDGRWLVSGAADTTLLVWDVAALRHDPAAPRPAPDVPKAWADLAAADAAKALAARWALIDAPEQAVPLLKERLSPARELDPARLRRLLADLDAADFEVREKATRKLEESAEADATALRRALGQSSSAEARRRLKQVLERREGPITAPERLRALRAVAVLESVGSAEARAVLERVAAGAPGARLTEEARAALARRWPR